MHAILVNFSYYLATLFLGVIFGLAATARRENSNRFFLSEASAFYDAAKAYCESLGCKPATLPLADELDEVNNLLNDQLLNYVFVGARVSPMIPECSYMQTFNIFCWEWYGFMGPQPMTADGVPWIKRVENLNGQDSNSRAVYDMYSGGLFFTVNIASYRILCENAPPETV